jgi:hypothetical protein
MKSARVGVLLIIELKNAQWNIEINILNAYCIHIDVITLRYQLTM